MKEKNRKVKKVSIILGILLVVSVAGMFVAKAVIFPHYDGRPVTGVYSVEQAEVILKDTAREDSFETDGTCCEVPVHFYYPGNAADGDKFPLVIFSHGAFGFYKSNYSTYTELASNGYVVAALDHPHHSFFTHNTEGKTIIVDTEFFANALNANDETTSEQEIEDMATEWLSLRTADVNFVIDTLKNHDSGSAFGDEWFFTDNNEETVSDVLEVTDFEKIGLMGHSLGGATAEILGRTRDDITAVIDLDGTMLGENNGTEAGEPYPVPILNIDNEEHHFSRIEAKNTGMTYSNNVVMDNAVEGYDTYFAKAGHMNFTDLPLFSPVLASLLGTGEIDAEYCVDETNRLVLEFFSARLKGNEEFSVKDCYGN